ncbi:MAG: hypothetical protein IKZ91_04500 [Bacteroidales bacterium]|nr:hypothetical protein [Bacteroidales bacterium]
MKANYITPRIEVEQELFCSCALAGSDWLSSGGQGDFDYMVDDNPIFE